MSEGKEEKNEGIIVKDARYEVTRTVFGEEKTDSGRINVTPFYTTPANISVKGGATINLGNYESARIDVMLSYPCYREEIDDFYPKVKEWVDAKLSKEYKELKEEAKKSGGTR